MLTYYILLSSSLFRVRCRLHPLRVAFLVSYRLASTPSVPADNKYNINNNNSNISNRSTDHQASYSRGIQSCTTNCGHYINFVSLFRGGYVLTSHPSTAVSGTASVTAAVGAVRIVCLSVVGVRLEFICFTAALVPHRRFAANSYFVRISRKMAAVSLDSVLPWPEYFRQVLNSTSKDLIRIISKMSTPHPGRRSLTVR